MAELLEAFRQCGPTIGDPAVDPPRQAALLCIYRELRALSKRLRAPGEFAEDAVQQVVLKLMASGPRGERPDDPPNDSAVRGYLYTSLSNWIKDQYRGSKREVQADPERPDSKSETSQHFELETMMQGLGGDDEFARRIDAAVACLFKQVVPFAERQLRGSARARFRADIEMRRQIAEGKMTIKQGVEELFGGLNPRTRNSFDQRQCRSLKRLGDGLETYVEFAGVPAAEAHALRLVLQALKDREASWGALPEVQS